MAFKTFERKQLTPLLLRLGLAIVFIYASVSSFKNPQDWVGYLPPFLRSSASATTLLHVFSVYEMLLALWLISGRYVKYAALLCAATLVGIIASNRSLFAITFRDIALACAALALFFTEA